MASFLEKRPDQLSEERKNRSRHPGSNLVVIRLNKLLCMDFLVSQVPNHLEVPQRKIHFLVTTKTKPPEHLKKIYTVYIVSGLLCIFLSLINVCVCSVQSGVQPPHLTGAPCSWCVYRPDSGMEKRLPSTQNQWLLFSLLQRPPVICDEYKAHIVAHKAHAQTPQLYVHSPFTTVAAHKLTGDWAELQVSYT